MLLSILPIALLLLSADAQGNLLTNPTFETPNNATGDGVAPIGWSVHGVISTCDNTNGNPADRFVGLLSPETVDPSALFQTVLTDSSLSYTITFRAFAENAESGLQNLTVHVGDQEWSAQPSGIWNFYSFTTIPTTNTTLRKRADSVVKFAGANPAGGKVQIANLDFRSSGGGSAPPPPVQSS